MPPPQHVSWVIGVRVLSGRVVTGRWSRMRGVLCLSRQERLHRISLRSSEHVTSAEGQKLDYENFDVNEL